MWTCRQLIVRPRHWNNRNGWRFDCGVFSKEGHKLRHRSSFHRPNSVCLNNTARSSEETGPLSIRPTLELFQNRHWGIDKQWEVIALEQLTYPARDEYNVHKLHQGDIHPPTLGKLLRDFGGAHYGPFRALRYHRERR